MLLHQQHLEPDSMVLIDQYVSTVPGQLPHMKGKELKKDHYCGGTLFVDHATRQIFLHNQSTLQVGDILCLKQAFKKFVAEHGINVHGYHVDNVPFGHDDFLVDLETHGQTITFSGVGAHHQNGVAERVI
jgi:hypothetical protein